LAAIEQPFFVSEAWRRATALAVTGLGLIAGAPWIHEFVDDLAARWDRSNANLQPWHYGLLGLVVWLGLLPLALFIWSLPSRGAGERSFSITGGRASAGNRSFGGPARGLDLVNLVEDRPYSEPVRRACHLHACGVALCAPERTTDRHGGRWRRPPLEVILLLPAVFALLLIATVNFWIVLVMAAAILVWCAATYSVSYRSALAAPGSVIADYLLLTGRSADRGTSHSSRLAQEWLELNPAILQDHEQLAATLSGAVRVGAVPWSPVAVSASNVELTTRLWVTDHRGRDREIVIAFHLRRRQATGWRIARIAMEAPNAGVLAPGGTHFPLASVWRPV
jgi:hypothetical protein